MEKFYPHRGANQVLTAGAVSLSVALEKNCKAVRIVNVGANVAHVRIGAGTQTATVADTPVRTASEVIIGKADGEDTLAYISAAGATLHVQTGEAV